MNSNLPNGFKKSSDFKWIQMKSNEFKCYQIESNGFKWIKIDSDKFKFVQMISKGLKWIQMIFNGFKMISNGLKWNQTSSKQVLNKFNKSKTILPSLKMPKYAKNYKNWVTDTYESD